MLSNVHSFSEKREAGRACKHFLKYLNHFQKNRLLCLKWDVKISKCAV